MKPSPLTLLPNLRVAATAIAMTAIAISSETARSDEPPPAGSGRLSAQASCTASEKWAGLDQALSSVGKTFQGEFEGFLSGKHSQIRGLSQGFALRRIAPVATSARALSDYWIARALYQGKLVHSAHLAFATILQTAPSPQNVGTLIASLDCLNQIQREFASLSLPSIAATRMPELLRASLETEKPAVWIGAFNLLLQDLKPAPLAWLKGAGDLEQLALGIWAAHERKHSEAVTALSRGRKIPRYREQAEILLARSLYALGRYAEASDTLSRISKSSNQLSSVLSEMAWSHLMNDRLNEAIGTAISLSSGSMRTTFAPEGPMVMAMALNELCHFPASLGAVNSFRRNYEKPYLWLEAWNQGKTPGIGRDLYSEAIKYLKRQSEVPSRVGSEWIRSSVFIANQDEINLIFDESESIDRWESQGAEEQVRLASDILARWKELKTKIRRHREGSDRREALPPSMAHELQRIKTDIVVYRRIGALAPIFAAMAGAQEKRAPGIRGRLVAQINRDLADKTRHMYLQLQDIAENNQLIEVEIYNGASQDIVFQNAHPEYKKIAETLKDSVEEASASKVWNWGRTIATSDEVSEVWEDELGAFKADLYDNCSNQKKYLALKGGRS